MFSKSLVLTATAGLLAISGSPSVLAGSTDTASTVTSTPASFTPWLLASVPDQNVQQLVQCGDTMYAAGTITAIGQGSSTYSRGNAFSFSATTGLVSAWDPQVSGSVNTVALSPDCSTAYLGGKFTSVRGTAAYDIAAVDTSTGALKSAFAHTANGVVNTLEYTHGMVLAGGAFTTVNGASRTRFASLDPTTGLASAYADLAISGAYPKTTTRIYNAQLSHDGNRMLVEGVFTSIAGQPRQQVAMFDLGASAVTLDTWYASEFNQPCQPTEPFYAQAASWSADDQTVFVATTGDRPASGAGSDPNDPRAGLCAAASAFPSTGSTVSHRWINYSGCDSFYSVVADANNVYVGGHERWANNSVGCDRAGTGAVGRPGIGSLTPSTGQATAWNPTRARGHGATDLLLTAAGLWIASDNFQGSAQKCGGVPYKGGICFFPY